MTPVNPFNNPSTRSTYLPLAADLTALEASQTSATRRTVSIDSPSLQRRKEWLRDVLHSAANAPTTVTTTDLHLFLGGLFKSATGLLTEAEKSSITYGLLGHSALVLLSNRRRGAGGLLHGEGVGVPGRGVLVLLVGGLEPGEVEHGEWSEELVGNNTPGIEAKQS